MGNEALSAHINNYFINFIIPLNKTGRAGQTQKMLHHTKRTAYEVGARSYHIENKFLNKKIIFWSVTLQEDFFVGIFNFVVLLIADSIVLN